MKLSKNLFYAIPAGIMLLHVLLVLAGLIKFSSTEGYLLSTASGLAMLYFGWWLRENKVSWRDTAVNGAIAGVAAIAVLIVFTLIGKMLGRPVLGIAISSNEALLLLLAVLAVVNIFFYVLLVLLGALTAKIAGKS
ncbi:MAG: hypothetical protein V1492_02890 [Candidatus Micrarchaeota archaeon]